MRAYEPGAAGHQIMSHLGALNQLRIIYGLAGLSAHPDDRQSRSVAHNVLPLAVKTRQRQRRRTRRVPPKLYGMLQKASMQTKSTPPHSVVSHTRQLYLTLFQYAGKQNQG
jgi:hypothetical protein